MSTVIRTLFLTPLILGPCAAAKKKILKQKLRILTEQDQEHRSRKLRKDLFEL